MTKKEYYRGKLLAYQAIYILTNGSTRTIIRAFDVSLEEFDALPRSQLKITGDGIIESYLKLKRTFGAIASDEEYIRLARYACNPSDGRVLMLSKKFIDSLFTNYASNNKDYPKYTNHTLIQVDPGLYREIQGTYEVYLIEATLFEDLCIINNELRLLHNKTEKYDYKKRACFARSLIVGCFNLLESYLNGIAYDYYIDNLSNISIEDKNCILEINHKGNKKYLSLKDKLYKYPAIITKKTDATYSESDIRMIEYLLENEKRTRDSIVHSSPTINGSDLPDKMHNYINLSETDSFQTLKITIDIIKVIEKQIHNNTENLWWLSEADTDGLFPSSTFR